MHAPDAAFCARDASLGAADGSHVRPGASGLRAIGGDAENRGSVYHHDRQHQHDQHGGADHDHGGYDHHEHHMTVAEAARIILQQADQFRHCVRCGAPVVCIGVFAPDNSVEFGGNLVQQRVVGYGLCEACFDVCEREPQELEAIEAAIRHRLTSTN